MADFQVLESAKQKMLQGEFSLAASYYGRARSEGVADCAVDLRFITKNYLVYPLEYENSSAYFDLLKELRDLSKTDSSYQEEYRLALGSFVDLRKLFLRSLSLFYFSDIQVCSWDGSAARQIFDLYTFLSQQKEAILSQDIFEIKTYLPDVSFSKLERNLLVVETYCLNLLLTYTGVQQSNYAGKRYNAFTVDYGYFACTTVKARDVYFTCATMQPRLFLLNMEVYYDDMERLFQALQGKLGGFNSPKELRKELNFHLKKSGKKDPAEQEFLLYAKHFEKEDASRSSLVDMLNRFNLFYHLCPALFSGSWMYDKNSAGSFELDEPFPRKKLFGVCDMLSAGQGWSLDTVRWCMVAAGACAGLGVIAYLGLAVMKKLDLYPYVHVKKH